MTGRSVPTLADTNKMMNALTEYMTLITGVEKGNTPYAILQALLAYEVACMSERITLFMGGAKKAEGLSDEDLEKLLSQND